MTDKEILSMLERSIEFWANELAIENINFKTN